MKSVRGRIATPTQTALGRLSEKGSYLRACCWPLVSSLQALREAGKDKHRTGRLRLPASGIPRGGDVGLRLPSDRRSRLSFMHKTGMHDTCIQHAHRTRVYNNTHITHLIYKYMYSDAL